LLLVARLPVISQSSDANSEIPIPWLFVTMFPTAEQLSLFMMNMPWPDPETLLHVIVTREQLNKYMATWPPINVERLMMRYAFVSWMYMQ
jgi:hypothetical protein